MYLLVCLLLQVCSTDMNQDKFYIYFERSGGFAGIAQTLEMKSDTLSQDDQDHLRKMIKDSGFFSFAEESKTGLPDQFNYVITIKNDEQEKTIRMGETNMPASLRPLVDYLRQKARNR
jgi:hypothetical protein